MFKLARQADPTAPKAVYTASVLFLRVTWRTTRLTPLYLSVPVSICLRSKLSLFTVRTCSIRQSESSSLPPWHTSLTNMRRETESNWHLDLQEDIQEEVEAKYGKLVQIFVDKQSSVSQLNAMCDRSLIPSSGAGRQCLHEICRRRRCSQSCRWPQRSLLCRSSNQREFHERSLVQGGRAELIACFFLPCEPHPHQTVYKNELNKKQERTARYFSIPKQKCMAG